MAELTTPFNYRDILIGEEVLYRALVQQEDFANTNKYGATWSSQDLVEKSSAYFKANVLRADFAIPAEFQHCVPYPPCPWNKEDDSVGHDQFNPIIMSAGGVYTFTVDVHRRTDTGTRSFSIGAKVIEYSVRQENLHPNIRSEFTYYKKLLLVPDATGAAVIVIKRYHRGALDQQFHYLFDLFK